MRKLRQSHNSPVSQQPVTPAIQKPVLPKSSPPNRKLLWLGAGVVIILLAVGGWYLLSNTKTGKPPLSIRSGDIYTEETYNPALIAKAADTVEAVFAAADTAGLTAILSPHSLSQYRPVYGELVQHMPAFAVDFRSRKLLYATARFAVYSFSAATENYTIDFCLGEDGRWKLMRF
ncbi:MAG: hypothetical protein IPH18_12170 [Chitinophagaceae bacterium]|nr:hypothetical protein [Chitinophagaceae bacterium]